MTPAAEEEGVTDTEAVEEETAAVGPVPAVVCPPGPERIIFLISRSSAISLNALSLSCNH